MRKAIALILFLIISAVATANTSSTAIVIDGRFKVSGRVIDESTLQPLPYAIVKVSNLDLWATTDANGTFAIENIPQGTTSNEVRTL